MRTDELIRHLAAEPAPHRPRSVEAHLALAFGVGLAAVLVLVAALLGIRPDLGTSLTAPAGLLKVLASAAVAAAGFHAARRLARPDTAGVRALGAAPLAVVAAASGVGILLAAPAAGPGIPFFGPLPGVSDCARTIFTLSLVPLAASLLALRSGAPTRPGAAGAAAGLLSGGVAAAAFSLHCPMDDPALVVVAYGLGVCLVSALGGAAGARLLRW